MSTRLTNHIRDAVLEHLMDRAFGPREKQLKKLNEDLTEAIYLDQVSIADQRRMARLPKGWLPVVNQLRVKINGKYHHRYFPKQKENRMVPSHVENGAKVYADDTAISKEHHRLSVLEADLKNEKDEARKNARAALESATTVNRLGEIWPDIKPFLQKFAGPPASKQLAVPLDIVNKQLGLGGHPLPQAKPPKGRAARAARSKQA